MLMMDTWLTCTFIEKLQQLLQNDIGMWLQLCIISVLEDPDSQLHALLLEACCCGGSVHTAQDDLRHSAALCQLASIIHGLPSELKGSPDWTNKQTLCISAEYGQQTHTMQI